MPDVDFNFNRPRKRSVWPFVIIGFALVAGIAVYRFKDIQMAYARWNYVAPPPPTVREDQHVLWVADKPISAYTRIKPEMLKGEPKSKKAVEGKSFLEPSDIAFRVPIIDIEPGTPFRETMLAPKGTRPGLSAGIPTGCVAITLEESAIEGQTQGLSTGDFVALLAVLGPHQTEWVSERVKVLLPLRERKTIVSSDESKGPPLLKSNSTKMKTVPIKELTLAIPGEDIVKLTRAQSQPKSKLRILLLSGVAGGDKLDSSAFKEQRGFKSTQIETIEGSKRSLGEVRYWSDGEKAKEPDAK